MVMPIENTDEPFLACGYGINSYFAIMKSLQQMFIIISLVTLPLLIIYLNGNHFDSGLLV